MTKTAILIALLLASGSTFADVNATNTQSQQTQASTDGNRQTIEYNSSGNQNYSGSYEVKSVPNAIAPSLTTTLTETCMGSSTGAVSVMGMGVSGGTTWKDEECVRRLNARELAALGEKDAAKELMCGNPEVYAVYKALGRPCKMTPSSSVAIPGGALVNYREPVENMSPAEKARQELKDKGY